ncbi:MAG: ATP-dependent Clp protease proteolytic subunit [Candidatus Paceibacterota bacterium]|jgi:ATP-dependent protease ClpP protease subunit
MSLTKVESNLLKKGVILVCGKIEQKMSDYMEESFATLYLKNSPDITVLISSVGGNVGDGLFIYDLLSLYPGRKTAIVVGEAYSMAAIILQACDKRFAMRHAKILTHNTTSEIKLDVLRDKRKLRDTIADIEKRQMQQYIVVSKRSGKSIKEVRAAFAKDKPIPVDEAIKFGLLDGIWDKPLPK